MPRVVDLGAMRKTRRAKSELFRSSAKELLLLLDRQRQEIAPDFMLFLLAMAVSEQAMYYANRAGDADTGRRFIDDLFNSARQIYETHFDNYQEPEAPNASMAGIVDLPERD